MKRIFAILVLLCGSLSAQTSVVEVLADDFRVGHGVVVEKTSEVVADGVIGYVATAWHVVEGMPDKKIRTRYSNGKRAKDGWLFGKDTVTDIAIVKVWVPNEVPATPVGDVFMQTTWPNDQVATIRIQRGLLFSDVILYPGDSGSPVFNEAGEVVGIVSGGWLWMTDEHGRQYTWPGRAGSGSAIRNLLRR